MEKMLLRLQRAVADAFRRWGPRSAYGIAVGIGGGLASLLLIVVSGPRFSNVEQWEAIALGWSLLGGAILVLASIVSGMFLHDYYIQCRSWPVAVLVFAVNVLVVAALALLAAAWAAGL
jgi:hypothetical protein